MQDKILGQMSELQKTLNVCAGALVAIAILLAIIALRLHQIA